MYPNGSKTLSIARTPSSVGLKIGDVRAVPALIEVLGNPSMTFNATQALGDIGAPRAVLALLSLLSDERKGIRLKVAEALRKIGTPEAIKAVEASRVS
jgi:HEAT repeat protein